MVKLDSQPQITQIETFEERAIPFLPRSYEFDKVKKMIVTHFDTMQRVPMMPLYSTRATNRLSPMAIVTPYCGQRNLAIWARFVHIPPPPAPPNKPSLRGTSPHTAY